MNTPKRSMPWANVLEKRIETVLDREWLLTNGLGGYASGTVASVPTRRYHGYLIAALPEPLGRVMMLNQLSGIATLPSGRVIRFGSEERRRDNLETHGLEYLQEFRLDHGLPVWRTHLDGWVIERAVVLPHKQNTAYLIYRLLEGEGPVKLQIRPLMHFRGHDDPVSCKDAGSYVVTYVGRNCEIQGNAAFPPLRLRTECPEGSLTLEGGAVREVYYRAESDRGYDNFGSLWSPGYFTIGLTPGRSAAIVASTEDWSTINAMTAEEALEHELHRRNALCSIADNRAHQGLGGELVLAADQFIITPMDRREEAARAHADGDEMRTVIAGYHWFTDWGRDTMISLEGLTLVTGRHIEGRWILKMFANAVKDGLIPNLFPEHDSKGLYHTADASLWFFHAISRYVDVTGDTLTLDHIMPKLLEIAEKHLSGTRFGIGVDPRDGLLRQGQEGYQLTWMDAKVDGWVVTPRRGKAVEINALWYNALVLLSGWLRQRGEHDMAVRFSEAAERCRVSFNARFWNAQRQCLFDVVDCERGGNDPVIRPNQLFAVSLPNAVLDPDKWESVVTCVREQLVTPVGLRSLARGEPDYKPQYFGDLRSRDAAYHQGTVWGFLIGHMVDAWLKLYPDDMTGARQMLAGVDAHMSEACIGSISEVFDAEAPFTPRGCIAQAWSVAEVLRAWVKTSPM